ncbi:MAG TPA: 3'-5' exonuclease, partial [bacterium]|nr:3'-5' exonuclease [bacterium]
VLQSLRESLDMLQSALFTRSGGPRSTRRLKSMAPVVEAMQHELGFLQDLLTISAEGEAHARTALAALLPLVRSAHDEWQRLRRHTGMLTFDDLEAETARLLNTHPESAAVVQRLQQRYQYFMVDEFQDTNAMQWDIIRPLVSGSNGSLLKDRLFIVGDPKQSIYGFRNADITVFNQVRKHIVDGNIRQGIESRPAEQAPGDIHMVSNFRSRPAILDFTDTVCGPVMTGGADYEARYEALEPDRDLTGDRPGDGGRVGILIPPDSAAAIESGNNGGGGEEPDELTAGNWFDLMTAHMTDSVRSGEWSWGDIAVIFPRRTRLDTMKTACRTAGIPFMVYKGIGFWQQPEIRDLTALVRWLADPGDRTALITVLRSPLFNISDHGLVWMSAHGSEFPGGAPEPAGQFTGEATAWPDTETIPRARDLLLEIRDAAGTVPLARLVEDLLIRSGGWGSYAAEDDSGQTVANIEKLLDILTGLDREGVAPMWETARILSDREAFDNREGEAIRSIGSDRITLLTVHAAKGLEFPVVYLVDLEQAPKPPADAMIIDDALGVGVKLFRVNPELQSYETVRYRRLKNARFLRDIAERKRLMYVAFTRARDRL